MPHTPVLTRTQLERHQALITIAARRKREVLAPLLRQHPDAVALWALGLAYCAEYDTGGLIAKDVLPELAALPDEVQALAVRLVDVALRQD